MADPGKAGLPSRERALLDFLEVLTLAPREVDGLRLERLAAEGWSRGEVLHAVLECALFNYLNRMADGLGIRLEYETSLPAFEPRGARRGLGSVEVPAPAAPGARGAAMAGDGPRGTEGIARELAALLEPEPAIRALVLEWRAHQLAPTAGLGRLERLRVALAVASLDGEEAAAAEHRAALADAGVAADAIERVAAGEAPPGAPARERRIVEHAARLARAPSSAKEEHVEGLRGCGLADADVLQLTALASYQTFEDRVLAGLRPGPPG